MADHEINHQQSDDDHKDDAEEEHSSHDEAANDLIEKQAMLRVELLDQGYDGEEFVKYIASDLQGKSLGEWTLEELKEVFYSNAESHRIQGKLCTSYSFEKHGDSDGRIS